MWCWFCLNLKKISWLDFSDLYGFSLGHLALIFEMGGVFFRFGGVVKDIPLISALGSIRVFSRFEDSAVLLSDTSKYSVLF